MAFLRNRQRKQKKLQKDLHLDDNFAKMNSAFNEQQYEQCLELANALREKYPDAKDIRQLQEEIEIRLLLEKLFKIKVRNTRIRNVITTSIVILLVVFAGYLIYSSFTNFRQTLSEQLSNNQQEMLTQQETAIESLVLQAQTLLESQNLTLAKNVIEEIEQLNPEDQSLPSLRATESYISELDELYTEAQAEQVEGNLDQAVTLYGQIVEKFPDFRDVNLQISAIEQQLLIQDKLRLAQEAYQNQEWATVIFEYEGVIALDSSLLDDSIKSELVNSYIKSIVQLIDKEDTTIEDIELAETYYKRSLALIPQSKTFEDERKTLDTLILNLLVVKYLEYADTLLDQSPFDEASIKVALKYLNSAYRLNPENTSLENEVKKTEYYYTGVQNFYDLDWSQCISILELLREMDPEYGNQAASYLLYEAYMAYGTQRASYGLYLDAKHNFEEAEFLVWDQMGTPTRIFYTQLEIAYSAGKSHSYEQSVSYYEYALEEFLDRNTISTDSVNFGKLTKAEAFSAESLYFDAYYLYADFFSSAEEVIYKLIEVEVFSGNSLLDLAYEYGTTVQAIIKINNLPNQIVILSNDQTLRIPVLP